MRNVVAFVVILSAIVPLAAWGRRDTKLDPAAVKAVCQASEDAVSAERRAERDFDDAAAVSQRDAWDQSLAIVSAGSSSRVAERESRLRLSAELIAAARKRTYTTDLALGAASELSAMRAQAVHLKDDISIIALDKCQGDADRYSKAFEVGAAP